MDLYMYKKQHDLYIYNDIAVLVVNYGISNTVVLETP